MNPGYSTQLRAQTHNVKLIMNKIVTTIVLIATSGLILTGCAGDNEPKPAPEPEPVSGIISEIPWPDTEFTGYVIQDYDGNEIGSGALLIRKIMDIYNLNQRYVFEGKLDQIIMANVRIDNLKPLAGTITIPEVALYPVVTYIYKEDGTLTIDAATKEGSQQTIITVPEDAYDYNELLFLLRTIPFEINYTATFTNVIVNRAEIQIATITVVGQEELQVPAGNFDTYKVEFTSDGNKKYLWYAREKPHYLVKLDDGTGIILLEEIRDEF